MTEPETTWRIVTIDPEGRDGTSSALGSRETALAWACDLHFRQGFKIVGIEASDGQNIASEHVLAWCECNKDW